jgi:pimeloyl-ACP methyl ester carboxylesterase
MSFDGITATNSAIKPPSQQDLPLEGVRLGKVAKIAFHVLTALAVVATGALIAASIITGALPVAVLVVSSVALGILLTAQAVRLIHPYLPEKLQHVINVIRATVVDIFCAIGLAAMFPVLQTWFDPKEGDIDPDQTPILLVHGYLHNSSGWAYHRYQYKKAGFQNVFTVNLGHPLHSIEDYSEVVKRKVEEIRQITGRNDVKLVGHSMGGVVSAHYALNHAKTEGVEVKDLITLGSPLMGTHLGHIGIGKCAKEMCYGSGFIANISRRLHEEAIPHFHQGSVADLVIFPHNSSLNDEDEEHALIYKDMGHASFMLSDRVARANIHRFRSAEV